jgi:hypothetical protein
MLAVTPTPKEDAFATTTTTTTRTMTPPPAPAPTFAAQSATIAFVVSLYWFVLGWSFGAWGCCCCCFLSLASAQVCLDLHGVPEQVSAQRHLGSLQCDCYVDCVFMVMSVRFPAHPLPFPKLDAPLFITWYQCVVTVAICVLLGASHTLHPYFKKYPQVEYNMKIALQVSQHETGVIVVVEAGLSMS